MIMKDVALVLSSGGPRGFAYIGAIEELESRGYNITSIAGTSIGSLIGGMYAAGKLPEVKEFLFSLNGWKVFSLMDISISRNHLVKGDKVIEALQEIVPDVNIEDLRLPYKAIATDLLTGEEIIFDKGDLFHAIRASISIPSLFRPVKMGMRTLIDGGIANTMPLNRVERSGHDILVAFNVNDIDVDAIRQILVAEADATAAREHAEDERKAESKAVIDSVIHNDTMTFIEKLRLAGMHGHKLIQDILAKEEKPQKSFDPDANYFTILSRTFDLMNHWNTELMMKLCPPDIIVKYLKYPIASILIVGVKASDPKKLKIEQIKKNIFIPPPTVILNLVLLKIQLDKKHILDKDIMVIVLPKEYKKTSLRGSEFINWVPPIATPISLAINPNINVITPINSSLKIK